MTDSVSTRCRTLLLEHRLLHIPLKTGAAQVRLNIIVAGGVVRTLVCELADGEPDYWSFTDVTPWLGLTATLEVEDLHAESQGLDAMATADGIIGAENLYAEALRPQFHFSTKRGWLNDPNGLSLFNGEYHLFYQHSPFIWASGRDKYWGHAVSRDLLHWEELPAALEPDEFGPMYSGSAVWDADNTSGLGTAEKPPLVLAYTADGAHVQCIASTTDGRTITKYAGNPVLGKISAGNRDPYVFRHEATGRWIMVLYVAYPAPGLPNKRGVEERDTFQFFSSRDLKEWTYLSEVGGWFECPDMIELCLDGNPGKKKYILTGADGEYQVGDFDGRAFIPGTPKIPGQRGYGNAMYAAQTFANMPGGRVVQIGWLQTPAPGMTFNQSMGFPCELTLRSTPDGPRMAWNPIGEISRLAVGEQEFGPQTLQPGENPLAGVTGRLLDIEAVLEPEEGAGAGFRIRGVEVVYDSRRGRLLCPGLGEAELAREDGLIHLRLLVDRISIEIFGNRGLVYMPVADKPLSQELGLGIFARGGTVKIHALTVREICSIW